mgnify:CR=1 FL=1
MISRERVKDHKPLREAVKEAIDEISKKLDGKYPSNLYRLVINEVERPLFEKVLDYTDGNQSKASEILGITRSTLKKRLDYFDIDPKIHKSR